MLGLSQRVTYSAIAALICAVAAALLFKAFKLNKEVNPEDFADVVVSTTSVQQGVIQTLVKLVYLFALWVVAVVLFVLALVLDRKWLATKYVAPVVFIALCVDFYLIFTL